MSRNRIVRSAYNLLRFNSSEYEPKYQLCYIQAVDSNDDAVEEIGDEYCIDCIDEGHKETVASFEKSRESYSENIDSLKWYVDSCPESDDIKICPNCGEVILTGILWTFDQEIDYWLDCDLKTEIHDPRSNYILRQITSEYGSFEKHPIKTNLLAKQIVSSVIPSKN